MTARNKARRVVVALTKAEAWGVIHAAGNIMDAGDDDVRSTFPNPARRAAAWRGYRALIEAWRRA